MIDDLSTQKFDEWTVLERVASDSVSQKKKDQRFWKCRCSCGHIANMTTAQLKNAKRPNKMCRSCAVKKKLSGAASARYTGFGDLPGRRWRQILKHAQKRNLVVTITIEDCWNLFLSQNAKCALSGLAIGFGNKATSTASLDRIDSKKPYDIGNVQWVHKDVQRIKIDLPQARFVRLCCEVAKHFGGS